MSKDDHHISILKTHRWSLQCLPSSEQVIVHAKQQISRGALCVEFMEKIL